MEAPAVLRERVAGWHWELVWTCLPNFLLAGWEVTSFVDLGDLGVADRWRDIAVTIWSLGRNLGPGWDDAFLEAYGVERDERKLAFYQELYWKL